MSSNWVGKTLGKVQIEAPIARGGVAEVYLGTHITLQRKVAVKILRNPSEEHSDALERFQREARVVANLRHPNIVQVYDFDMVENDPYLVMEYIQGPSLSKHLYFLHQNNERLELPQVERLIRGVASALQYAHNNSIIHRDIKPGNILLISPTKNIEAGEPLPNDFEPVLTDFGLVRFLDSSRQTTTGVTAGTPAYMSPEQAQGEVTDGRTDVYSLGIVLYEMLAGELPFDGETTMSVLLKHVSEPPKPIPGLPPFMQKILDRALAKKANDRFQTPMEFANALSAAVDINPATMQMESLASLGPSTIEFQSAQAKITAEKPKQSRISNWGRLATLGIIVLSAGAFLLFNGIPSLAFNKSTPTIPSSLNTATATVTGTSTPTPLPVALGTSVILHFQDGNSLADQAVLEAQRMPAPSAGNQYEVWLVNGRNRVSLGILSLNEEGMGELTYTDPQGANLAALYNQAEITVEPNNDTKPASSGLIAYSFTMPAKGLANVRYLLATYNNTPNKIALIQGLYANIKKINELALGIQPSYKSGDETSVRQNAEAILNMIVGAQSSKYKDWDGDGTISDGSDGYGLTLNGSSPGYFQAVYSEADNTVRSVDASEPMITYGEHLKTSVQNMAQWAQQLEEIALAVLDSPNEKNVADLTALADRLLNGVDLDNDGTIEPIPGESGAQFAYDYAYSMADMPLLNVGNTPTPSVSGGGTSSGGSNAPPPKPKNTPRPPNENKPTKKP
ncbi:MAG TPA: protein kinase [Anaerolineales bacterium]|nr:protein kinase [Anaerolineales bacterium]